MSLPALLLVPALLGQAQSTFYAAWEDGRDAERRGQFAAALAAYQRAVDLRPKPAARVIIYGNNLLEGYFPYTRIARCNLALGLTDAAEAALARAEREGEPAPERQALALALQDARGPEARRPEVHPPAKPTDPRPAAPLPVQEAPAAAPTPTAVQARPAAAAEPSPVRSAPLAAPPPASTPSHPAPAEVRPQPVAEIPAPALAPPPAPAEARPTGSRIWSVALAAAALAATAGAFLLGRRRKPARALPGHIGPYQVQRLLGRGGFASTYLARREGDARPVALKVLHAFRGEDPEFLRRFHQEARLGSLLDHPGIVRLLDRGETEEAPWIAMEYVEGRRLDLLLRETGPLPLARVLDIGRQLAGAMAHAHARGVVHRDLKPANIILVGDQAKVMDFGIARVMDAETLTTTYAFLGTPLYAAPELQTLTQVGPPADAYALGIILFELLAGKPPFQGETPFEILDQHRRLELPDPAGLRPDVPGPLADLVRRLASKDPAARPGDAEVQAVLDGLVNP